MILPMIDVPVSLIGTFAVMAVMGYSLNNISLFGLVLAIGIVVDDAIVVLENIERQMAKGYDTRTATIKAMEEISGPIMAITLVLCAVFVPCAFISGITGRFFRQFAVTIAASTVISAINALTMTPSRALMIFKTKEGGEAIDAQPEALPWWIFGLLGVATLRLSGRPSWPTAGTARLPGRRRTRDMPTRRIWAVNDRLYFAPACWSGWRWAGSSSSRSTPCSAGFFRGFNRGFDQMTAGYGWTDRHVAAPERDRAAGLRRPARSDLLRISGSRPPASCPQQDQGRLIVSVQLPDSRQPRAHRGSHGPGRRRSPATSRRRPHDRPVRHFLRRAGQRPQLRLVSDHPQAVRRAPAT